jgi:hypothetical protein
MAIDKSWRGLVSLTLLVSGLIAGITGLVLYIVPAGRVANWVEWSFFGLMKPQWQAIHTLSSFLILVFAVLHAVNNWSSIKNYLLSKSGGLNQTKNIVAALGISAIIVISGIFALPPLQGLMDMGAAIKENWVISPDYEPPFGHAEEQGLKAFCLKMNFDFDEVKAVFAAESIVLLDDNQTLASIASEHGITPMALYGKIKHLQPKLDVEEVKALSDEEIEAMFAGSGLGRRFLTEVAEQFEMSTEAMMAKFEAAGLEVSADENLKTIKDRYPEKFPKATDVIKLIIN